MNFEVFPVKPFTDNFMLGNFWKFDDGDVLEEIAIDEDEQSGRPAKSKVFWL